METSNETNTSASGSGAESASAASQSVSTPASSGAGSDSGVAAQSKTPGAGGNQLPAGGSGIPDSVTSASGDSATPGVPEWTPNFKFKVKDKELEFDDSLKGVIKSKDLEAKMRELHEKAYGLDEVKTNREAVKQQLIESQTKFGQVEQSLKTLGSYVQKKDYHSFFDALKIPKQDIINYAIQELKYQELPADQKAAIDQQRQLQMGYESQLTDNQRLQQQLAQLTVQQTTFEMNQELARPEVSQVAQSYDARVGKPGAFREEIIRRGQFYENVHQVSPPVSQLVTEILNLVGVSQAQQGTGNIPSSNGQASQVVQQSQQQQKPVIPSFQGASSGKSPTKKVPSSIDDLRKMRQDLQQRQG